MPKSPPTLEDIPTLVAIMRNSSSNSNGRSVQAVRQLYELCDVSRTQNRIPMVCSGEYDVLTPLAKCLSQEQCRRFACLALNNLSIPAENKLVMALGPSSKEIIGGLYKIISEDKNEAFLCCICLMNLSYLEEGRTAIGQYCPVDEEAEVTRLNNPNTPLLGGLFTTLSSPLDNPNSLLRVLEKVLVNSSRVLPSDDKTAVGGRGGSNSAPQEKVRWACGLIKNLAKSEQNAVLIVQTEIVHCVVENIRSATLVKWAPNSLEDFSLFAILNLAEWPKSKQSLINAGAVDVAKPIMVKGGLQGLKATMICALLDAPLVCFPDQARPAIHEITDLMLNILEKKGKDGGDPTNISGSFNTSSDTGISPPRVVTPTNNSAQASKEFKIFVLLLQPRSMIFELIQLLYEPLDTTLGMILDRIPDNVTEPALGSQEYIGLCRPKQADQEELLDLDLLASSVRPGVTSAQITLGEILVAIPRGYTGQEVASLSRQILANPKIVKLLKRADPLAQKKGEDGQYADGVFQLPMACKAYFHLAQSASRTDSMNGNLYYSQVIVNPIAVSLLLRIVSGSLLQNGDSFARGSCLVPDEISAEYCVLAMEVALPAILQTSEARSYTAETENKACSEIHQLLQTYAENPNVSSRGKNCALSIANSLQATFQTPMMVSPLLEDAYMKWQNGQPNL